MAAVEYNIHSQTPEQMKVERIAAHLQNGAVILYPTDTGFSLGCNMSDKKAIERLRQIRRLPEHKALTFLCESLSHIAEFAHVSNTAYRAIKRLIPGPYTFILPASKKVPYFAQDPKRKTAGIRVPNNNICKAFLSELGHPIISITAKRDNMEPPEHPDDFIDYFLPVVDVAVRSDKYPFLGESTVINMTAEPFTVMREGAGIETARQLVELE